jgi:hypothetical protein
VLNSLSIDCFYNLADGSHPTSQALGPTPLADVTFWWMDDGCSVALLPAVVVLNPFETLLSYVGPRRDRARADEPGLMSLGFG